MLGLKTWGPEHQEADKKVFSQTGAAMLRDRRKGEAGTKNRASRGWFWLVPGRSPSGLSALWATTSLHIFSHLISADWIVGRMVSKEISAHSRKENHPKGAHGQRNVRPRCASPDARGIFQSCPSVWCHSRLRGVLYFSLLALNYFGGTCPLCKLSPHKQSTKSSLLWLRGKGTW